ncbi:MAG: hypothetical protein WD939_01675 [Dehalococcoidia bacterium]
MPVKTWVGRFAIVKGQPQEESPLLRSFPRQRPDEEEDELYVLVEPTSETSEEYAGQLVDAIGRMYRQDALSITGAVLRALKAAHQQLLDWNARTLREQQVGAGVSCLAVRDRSAYLAQIGPSVAYHVGGGRFRRTVPEGEAVEPLGLGGAAEPTFSRYQLEPGDLLLIASPKIDEMLDEARLRSILLRGGDEALVELFRIASDAQDFSLVLLACVVEPEDAGGPEGDAYVATGAPLEEPAPDVTEGVALAPTGAGTPADEAIPAFGQQPDAGAAPPLDAPLEEPQEEQVPEWAQEEVPPAPAGLTQPPVRIKGPEAAMSYRRSTGVAASLPRIPLPAVIAVLLLAAVGLLAWLVLPSALEESRDDQFADFIAEARASLDAALATDDPAQRREALQAAEAALGEAEQLEPDSAEAARLRAEIEVEKARLDAVVVLPELELITDISERVPGAVSPRDLALGGGGAYFLDREQGRVIALSLLAADPEPFVLFEGGDLIGAEITGQPQQIAWAEELGALLILDDARRLIAVTPPAGGRLLTVRSSESWGSADGIAYHEGSLYVLDRAGDQVWLYPPSETGFDSERTGLLDAFDLETVLELSVGDELYLVMGDDTIVRFPGSVARPFTQAAIDVALSSPASLAPLPGSGLVLVADRGNARVVVFTTDGTFRQQYQSPSLTDLRAIAVDGPNRLLYMLVGGRLYRTPMPALPAALPDNTNDGDGGGGATPGDGASSDGTLNYEIVAREDVGEAGVVQPVYRILLPGAATEAVIQAIAEEIIEQEIEAEPVNAIGFFFYLPDTDTTGPYTAGTATWAPNGLWGDADTVVAGDYASHELVVRAGSSAPP